MRYSLTLCTLLLGASTAFPPVLAAGAFVPWQAEGYAIKQPLGGLSGDPQRGRDIARSKDRGNCLACHHLPIPEEAFHGTLGPPLDLVATRLNEGQIRLRVADEQRIVPDTVMPPYHRPLNDLTQVAYEYYGKPLLTAQELEDVVAYLMTLR